MEPNANNAKELDIYRDSALRYCGYANEVGESFRPVVSKVFVHLSYAVAVMYVLAECGDKSRQIYKVSVNLREQGKIIHGGNRNNHFQKPEILGGGSKPAAKMAGDVFLWQMLASVAIPGFIINRITYGCGKLIKMSKLKGIPRKWGATIIGLSSIPLIIRPIDHGVDVLMDKTYRKYVV